MRPTTAILSTCVGGSAVFAAAIGRLSPTTLVTRGVKVTRGPTSNSEPTAVTDEPVSPFVELYRPIVDNRHGINRIKLDTSKASGVTGKFYIGSNNYPVNLYIDVSSADTWLWTTDYRDPPLHKEDQAKQAGNGHTFYRPDSSATVQRNEAGDNWADYKNGAVGFKGYRDTVKLGDRDNGTYMHLINATFGGVYTYEGDVDQSGFDGVIGLGLDSKLFASTSGQWNHSLFAVDMNRRNGYYDVGSHIYLGGYDYDNFCNNFTWAGVIDAVGQTNSEWAINYRQVRVNLGNEEYVYEKKGGDGKRTPLPLVIDFTRPGTTLPRPVVDAFVREASGKYHDDIRPLVPCDRANNLPDITVNYAPENLDPRYKDGSDYNFIIKGNDLRGPPMGGQPGLCDVAIAPSEDTPFIGFHALKNSMVVHDFGGKQMGFATKKDNDYGCL